MFGFVFFVLFLVWRVVSFILSNVRFSEKVL